MMMSILSMWSPPLHAMIVPKVKITHNAKNAEFRSGKSAQNEGRKMKAKKEIQTLVAEILHDLRAAAGISKSKMAALLYVDERSYRRYEEGESSPTLAVFLDMLDNINAPVLPILMRHLYPESFSPADSTDSARHYILDYINQIATDRQIRQMAYILGGQHGSPAEAQLQMFCALDHMPMDIRLAVAKLTLNAWEISVARKEIVNPDEILPDAELLREAIIKAQRAVEAGRGSYTTVIK